MTSDNKQIWDEVYAKFGETLPWCIEEVPEVFKNIITSGWIKPCKTLDIGCGAGHHANYFAQQGFTVTAVDIADEAIAIAKKRFNRDNLEFRAGDVFAQQGKFDFVYEVSLFHNIEPDKRRHYSEKLSSLLNPQGKLMVCCFSDQDDHFKGQKSVYFPELNNTVYPLSRKEIIDTFSPQFNMDDVRTVYFGRKDGRQKERLMALMTKR